MINNDPLFKFNDLFSKKENFNIESPKLEDNINSIGGLDIGFFIVMERAQIEKHSDITLKELHEKTFSLYQKSTESINYIKEQIQRKIESNDNKYEQILNSTLKTEDDLHFYLKTMNNTLLTFRPTIKIEYGPCCIDPLTTHSDEEKMHKLLSKYKGLRTIRGDGNCFLYSFITRLLENYSAQGSLPKLIEFIDKDGLENSALHQFKPKLNLLKQEIKDTLLDLEKNPSKIEEILKDNHKILPLANYFRILSADTMITEKEQFECSFRIDVEETFGEKENKKSYEELLSEYVLKMGVDFNHPPQFSLFVKDLFFV